MCRPTASERDYADCQYGGSSVVDDDPVLVELWDIDDDVVGTIERVAMLITCVRQLRSHHLAADCAWLTLHNG